jgi:hypothetical protein
MPITSFGQIASSVRKRFVDIFSARSNTTGSLGIATDGSQWDAVNGTIQVTTGAATATTTPTAGGAGTTYPMATVTLPVQNNSISLAGTNEGSAVALWVQSSSDWWLVSVEGTQNTVTNYASAQNYNYAFTQSMTYASGTAFTQSTNFTSSSGFSSFSSGTTFNSATRTVGSPFAFQRFWASSPGGTTFAFVTNYFGATSNFSATAFTSTAGPFSTFTSAGTFYTYASGTTTTYNEFLRVRQSVASTVSIITSQLISTVASIKSLLVSTSGNQITAKAYSDNNFVTQIGADLVYTATGATVNTKYGLAVSPSTYNQSAIIGTSVNITRN